ncbi:MAG TPA: HAMP domain-containing sensor histidine kinase [Pedococcus sp.]|jgi:signal transduction histidine kinase|nr:HAMP domain-containing sensor histidine kinase [Pedococcus sp.]
MRRSVRHVALIASCVALLVLGVPLAVAIRWVVVDQERGELTRVALAASAHLDLASHLTDPLEVPASEPGTLVAVYGVRGNRAQGTGPAAADAVVRRATSGQVVDQVIGGDLVVAVPVSQQERVVAVVRAAAPRSTGWLRTGWLWAAQLLASAVALTLAAVVAQRRATRLARPLEELAQVSVRVSSGDFTAQADRAGIPELDQLAVTQNEMVRAVAAMVDRERRFATDASHQLRTPLTRLDLTLEAASETDGKRRDELIAQARSEVAGLVTTIQDVLALARSSSAAADQPQRSVTLGELAQDIDSTWHGTFAAAGRRLVIEMPADLTALTVPAGVAQQIVAILIDNALAHGSGTVTLRGSRRGGVLTVEVSDEGTTRLTAVEMFRRGVSQADTPGIGLALARELAESAQGRLVLAAGSPTTFAWMVFETPVSPPTAIDPTGAPHAW